MGLVLAACGGTPPKQSPTPREKTEEVATPEPEPEPAKGVGLQDPTNDPTVVEAAKRLLADCGATLDESTDNSDKPNQKRSYYSCEHWAADYGDLSFAETWAPTFVNLLDDPDVKVRAIGVDGLARIYEWRTDKALATRVVEALKREKAPSPIDHNLALRVADLPGDLGLDDQIAAIAIDPKTSTDVKLAILGWWRGEAAYAAVKANATTTDPAVINAVVQGYVLHFEEHTEEACAYWADHLETEGSEQAQSYALGHLTGGWGGNTTGDSESEDYISGGGGGPGYSETQRCAEAHLQRALDVITERVAAGRTEGDLIYALAYLAKDKLTPAAIRTRTIKLLKKMVEQQGYWLRASALHALVDTGDPAMKKYAQKFKNDEELADTVKEINSPPPSD